MTRRLIVGFFVVSLLIVGCSGGDEQTNESSTLPAGESVDPSDVGDLEDGTPVITQGVLVIDGEARLCEALAESFPPQCAGGSVALNDLEEGSVVGLETVPDAGVTWTNYPLTVSGTVDGGALSEAEVAGIVYEQEANGLKVRLYPAQRPFATDPLRTGEAVWWVIDATNVTSDGIALVFGSAQVAEVTISDGDTELYRWSDGKSFTEQVHELDFEAGRTASATLSDPLIVQPGNDYTLRAWITGVGAEDVVVTTPISIVQY
jgi:Intracellular proteinase inhibitor